MGLFEQVRDSAVRPVRRSRVAAARAAAASTTGLPERWATAAAWVAGGAFGDGVGALLGRGVLAAAPGQGQPRLAPKDSTGGRLLAVKDGIDQMLEQLALTDEERAALEGDREAVAALVARLADTPTPTPGGLTPGELGNSVAFIALTRHPSST
ncbi:hypothetical protein [Streptomyces sp. NPDC000618]|uniref:hypothetical protein n=1 Tax=Streptomyces sp. NPDC000618 TaxID=3154265 RepID=UPI0033180A64